MRITSDFFVAALTRRVFSDGGYGAVGKRGSAEAGAIFVVVRARDGTERLFGPAPQTAYGEGKPEDRRFAEVTLGEGGADARLARETKFDPDCWVVELEPARPISDYLDIDA